MMKDRDIRPETHANHGRETVCENVKKTLVFFRSQKETPIFSETGTVLG
jgi:hypothetical protein